MKQNRNPPDFSSDWAFGVSPISSRTAINELVPGDSGGKTTFSELNTRAGTTGSGGEIVDRYFRSICTIWLKFGLEFGSSSQQDVKIKASSSGRSSALGLTFWNRNHCHSIKHGMMMERIVLCFGQKNLLWKLQHKRLVDWTFLQMAIDCVTAPTVLWQSYKYRPCDCNVSSPHASMWQCCIAA